MFKINKEIFPLPLLYRTCYSFTDRYYVHLDHDPEHWLVQLKPKSNPSGEPDMDEGEFRNALLNDAFREKLAEKTGSIKELIVSRALYAADGRSAELQQTGMAADDEFAFLDEEMDKYMEDPLGIAVPWEEKHGNNQDEQ